MLGAWRTGPLPPARHRTGTGQRGRLIPAATLGAGRERPRGGRGAGAEQRRIPPASSHGNAPARCRDNAASLWYRVGGASSTGHAHSCAIGRGGAAAAPARGGCGACAVRERARPSRVSGERGGTGGHRERNRGTGTGPPPGPLRFRSRWCRAVLPAGSRRSGPPGGSGTGGYRVHRGLGGRDRTGRDVPGAGCALRWDLCVCAPAGARPGSHPSRSR